MGEDEVDKLLRKGEGWLASHPQREFIVARYLRHDRKLTRSALERLVDEETSDPDSERERRTDEEQLIEAPLKLWEQRIGSILSALHLAGAKTVIDLGCGEGKLLRALLADRTFERIVGMDVSVSTLETAAKRLRFQELPTAQRSRIELIHGSLMYRDARLSGFAAAVVAEVVEHLDPPKLAAFERVVFEHAQPRTVLVTTPNAEYNSLFPSLPQGRFRHKDHRFEWNRSEFQHWAMQNAERFGYKVRFLPIGDADPIAGPPTQMGIFEK